MKIVFLTILGIFSAVRAEIDVQVSGNSFFGDRNIKEVLAADPESYSRDGIAAWKDDAIFYVSDLYRKSGFFDDQVDVDMKQRDSANWDAVITIVENSRYLFDTVRVIGVKETSWIATVIDSGDLEAQPGQPYQEELIFKDRRFIQQEYGDAGYVRAKVDNQTTVKPETRTVKVDYRVEPSYPVIFDTLLIRNRRAAPADSMAGITRDHLLRSLVPYKHGDTVRLLQNDKLVEKLQYTGAFNFVRLNDSLRSDDAPGSAVILRTEERIPGRFRASVFYETQYGPGVSMDQQHNNFAGALRQVKGGGSLAQKRQTVYAGYGSPLTMGYMVRFDNDLDFSWYQDKPYHAEMADSAGQGLFEGDFRAANSTRLTWPLYQWLRLVGNAELEAKDRMLNRVARERTLYLNFIESAFLSFVNQPMDPTRGTRFAFTWGNGGDFNFTKSRHNWLETQTAYYYFFPSLEQVKMAFRLDGGRFFGEGGANSERFFLGGGRSVRSYGYHALFPRVDSLGVAFSTQNLTAAYFLTSLEIRLTPFAPEFFNEKSFLRYLNPLEMVPFVDFGKVWDMDEGFSFSTQKRGQGFAQGFGLRYPLLGIFNLRLDLAYGRPGGGRWPDAWVIDLAQAF